MLIELKCKNCGAPLTKSYRCDYCKSVFKIQNDEVESFTSCTFRGWLGNQILTRYGLVSNPYGSISSEEAIKMYKILSERYGRLVQR